MAATATAATTPRVDPQARTATLVAQHGPALLRVARRVSLCADDAHDAVQRALEIYLRRLDTIDPRTEAAWMRVVVRNEALAVRKSRSQIVGSDEVDFDSHIDEHQRGPHERMESAERVTRSTEALRGLKPDEARALLLKAEGLSYTEIGEQLNWSYTKVNRCITEGRARFRRLFGGIESGEQCVRFAPLLLALAEGSADADAIVRLKPHLRHCLACRADVRRLHGSNWSGVAAWLPLPGLLDRLRPSSVKGELYGLLSRLSGGEPLAGAMAAGGGRSSAATALIGVCLAGVSGGGYCALGGPLPELSAREPARVAAAERPLGAKRAAPSPAGALGITAPVATATPVAADGGGREPASRERERERGAKSNPSAPPAPASDEFTFEVASSPEPAPTAAPVATAAPASREPAAAPRTTQAAPGGEFYFER